MRKSYCCLLVGLYLLAVATSARGEVVIDQSFAPTSHGAIGSSVPLAQTFTVGISGVLTQVDLKLNTTDENTTVRILPTIFGVPDDSQVPLATVDIPPPSSGFWISADLTEFQIPVAVGDVLSIEFTSENAMSICFGETYPGGAAYIRMSGGWQLVLGYGGVEGDLLFQTWVEVMLTPIEMIENLVDDIYLLNLHHGIENGLDAKLDAALNALDDVNENNDVAACNTLEAFVNAVEAQRDNKISSEDADYLIGQIDAIILELMCQ